MERAPKPAPFSYRLVLQRATVCDLPAQSLPSPPLLVQDSLIIILGLRLSPLLMVGSVMKQTAHSFPALGALRLHASRHLPARGEGPNTSCLSWTL